MREPGMHRLCIVLFTLLLLSHSPIFSIAEEGSGSGGGEEQELTRLLLGDEVPVKDWIEEKTGEYLPLDTIFHDEEGRQITLEELIDKPTLILPIYFYCPSTCSRNLANMAVAMNQMKFEAGKDYRPIALSFSDTETPVNAERAKRNYLKLVYDQFPQEEWKFITGSTAAIEAVTGALGFHFKRMDDGTFLHPSAVIGVAEDGKIVRYVYGSFIPGDMDLAVASARDGTPSLSIKRFLDFCLSYDPDQNKPLFIYVKVGVVLFFTLLVVGIFLFSRKRVGSRKDGTKTNTEQD